MRIDDSPTGPLRPLAPRAEPPRPEPVAPRAAPEAPVALPDRPRRDTVQFSAAGRSLAARPDVPPGLSAERREAIRQQVLGGAYTTVEMADQVARRLLARGEL